MCVVLRLCAAGIGIGDEGAAKVAAMLEKNTTLTSIDLDIEPIDISTHPLELMGAGETLMPTAIGETALAIPSMTLDESTELGQLVMAVPAAERRQHAAKLVLQVIADIASLPITADSMDEVLMEAGVDSVGAAE